MTQPSNKELLKWIDFLSSADIPVLKQTARKLSNFADCGESCSPRDIGQVIKSDPLMVIKLMRYLQQNKKPSQKHEIMEVEQVLIMLGPANALEKVPASPLVEDTLGRDYRNALIRLLKVNQRARVASTYAFEWAVRLHDLHYEEVRIAALLHDIAEILMWCFAPKEMLEINAMQEQDKAVRSQHVQEKILGFSLNALQQELVVRWGLPNLLITLMNDDCVAQPRVRNVILAVNLARHAANGWDDAALPDDFADIGNLLNLRPSDIAIMVGAERECAVPDQ